MRRGAAEVIAGRNDSIKSGMTRWAALIPPQASVN
jgi:hypothetical protein